MGMTDKILGQLFVWLVFCMDDLFVEMGAFSFSI